METVLRTSENMKKCLCSECPSYTTMCKIKNYPINIMKLAEGLDNIDHFENSFSKKNGAVNPAPSIFLISAGRSLPLLFSVFPDFWVPYRTEAVCRNQLHNPSGSELL